MPTPPLPAVSILYTLAGGSALGIGVAHLYFNGPHEKQEVQQIRDERVKDRLESLLDWSGLFACTSGVLLLYTAITHADNAILPRDVLHLHNKLVLVPWVTGALAAVPLLIKDYKKKWLWLNTGAMLGVAYLLQTVRLNAD